MCQVHTSHQRIPRTTMVNLQSRITNYDSSHWGIGFYARKCMSITGATSIFLSSSQFVLFVLSQVWRALNRQPGNVRYCFLANYFWWGAFSKSFVISLLPRGTASRHAVLDQELVSGWDPTNLWGLPTHEILHSPSSFRSWSCCLGEMGTKENELIETSDFRIKGFSFNWPSFKRLKLEMQVDTWYTDSS